MIGAEIVLSVGGTAPSRPQKFRATEFSFGLNVSLFSGESGTHAEPQLLLETSTLTTSIGSIVFPAHAKGELGMANVGGFSVTNWEGDFTTHLLFRESLGMSVWP